MLTVTRRWLWLPTIAVLAAGCSAGSSHSTAQTSTKSPTEKPAVGWVRSDLKPVTQPESADGLLVLYVQAGGGLQVDALDPKTDQTVWHDSASPGGITPGVPPVLGVAGYQSQNGSSSLDYERVGQEAIKPCQASGTAAAAPPTVPGFVGTDVDGLTVWSEASKVTAAPMSS
jgi:hypothetical protein